MGFSMLYPRDDEKQREENMFRLYHTPGPTLFYGLGSSTREGDIVKITLGIFLQFSGCYLTTLGFTIENSFTPDGFPHNVSATVSFESMDICFVGPHGEFLTRGFGNQAQKTNAKLQEWVGKAQGAVGDTVGKGVDALNEGIDFITKTFSSG